MSCGLGTKERRNRIEFLIDRLVEFPVSASLFNERVVLFMVLRRRMTSEDWFSQERRIASFTFEVKGTFQRWLDKLMSWTVGVWLWL